MVAGESNLRGTREVQVIGGQVINLFGVLIEEAGTAHDLRGHQGRGHHGHEAVGECLIHGHGHQSQLEAGTNSLEVVEACARNLRSALGIDRIKAFAQCQVVLGFKAFGGKVTTLRACVAQDNVVILAAHGNSVED